MSRAKYLMVQGTSSDAGKSVLVAALCRFFANAGVKVAPFKPQNMALNSAACDGGEIGRAQALQALACRITPTVDMNPILLKPSSDTQAQIIVHGKVYKSMNASRYHNYKKEALPFVLESFKRLEEEYELIIVEGAGSPAEINLRDRDIANMGFAESVGCPVIIVADIDRGGVFAQIVGTMELLSTREKNLVCGFVINKFRGDITLLKPGLEWLENKVEKPVLGTINYLPNLFIDAEDALNPLQTFEKSETVFRVCILVFSRISNHTDFDSLRLHPNVMLMWVRDGQQIPPCELIILPGTKNVRRDLKQLFANCWHEAILQHLRYDGRVLGICGGFQMLGNKVVDSLGIEDQPGSDKGIGLLDFETFIEKEKYVKRVSAHTVSQEFVIDEVFDAYEIHCGQSQGEQLQRPLFEVKDEDGHIHCDGCMSEDGKIIGTYLHDLLKHPVVLEKILTWAGFEGEVCHIDIEAENDRQLERLAQCIENSLDSKFLEQFMP